MRIIGLLLTLLSCTWASGGQDLSTSWVGIVSLIIFVVGYYFVAAASTETDLVFQRDEQ